MTPELEETSAELDELGSAVLDKPVPELDDVAELEKIDELEDVAELDRTEELDDIEDDDLMVISTVKVM